jgi:hypothetical protein
MHNPMVQQCESVKNTNGGHIGYKKWYVKCSNADENKLDIYYDSTPGLFGSKGWPANSLMRVLFFRVTDSAIMRGNLATTKNKTIYEEWKKTNNGQVCY